MKLILHLRISFVFQLLLKTGDLPFQIFPLLLIRPDFLRMTFVEIMLVIIEILRHILHYTGLSFPWRCNHHCIETERFTVAEIPLYLILSLQAYRQNTKSDDSCHIR